MIAPNYIDAFYALLRAGLWENRDEYNVSGIKFQGPIDWDEVYQLAEEQSVVGLVLAGIEHSNIKPPQELLLQWIGEVQMLEQQNKAMNSFIAELVKKMREADIYTLLVKGQGIAQCYERPLWRACGDVDLLLSETNYENAKHLLIPLASSVDTEEKYGKHVGLTIASWSVELHGTQHCELSLRMDKVIDEVQKDFFYGGNVRSWDCNETTIFLPAPDNDVIFIFTHFLKHFFKEGVGLRQICDWCRLLWTYKATLNHGLLESRIRKMGLMSEWKVFVAFAVEYLGMPSEKIPLYDSADKWKKKAVHICDYIMEVGNMGHNRDLSYFGKYPYFIRKVISFIRRSGYLFSTMRLFPWDSIRFIPSFVFNGVRSALRGE